MMPSKRVFLALAAALTLATLPAEPPVAEATPEAEATQTKPMSELQITADSVEMDFENRRASFVGNVKVSDEAMLLVADKMIVHLAERNELRLIEAIGNVVISEVGTQKKATAGKAVFDVAEDVVVLSESPALADQGQWTLTRAHLITYDRGTANFRADGTEAEPIRISLLVPESRGEQNRSLIPGLDLNREEKEKQK